MPYPVAGNTDTSYLSPTRRIKRLNEPVVQNAEMDGFLLHLQNVKEEAIIKEETGLHSYSIRDVEMILNNDDETKDNTPGTATDQYVYSTAHDSTLLTYGSVFSSGKPSTLVTPLSKRTDRFAVKYSINTMPDVENGKQEPNHENNDIDEDDVVRKVIPRRRCSLVIHDSGPKPSSRFMHDRTEDKVNALENRIREHTRAFAASGLYEEPTDPTIASQRSIFAVGMICCDGEGRLNEKSVMLQSSAEHSGGECVRLDLQRLSHFSVFPGQLRGKATGEDNQPTNLLCKQRELSMIIAAGPFTTIDNLLFEPPVELLAYAKRRQPQLLVLLGPFVDTDHPDIKKGTTDRSFDEIFRFDILRIEEGDSFNSDLKSQPVSIILESLRKTRSKLGAALWMLSSSFYPLYPRAESVPLDLSLAPEALQLSLIPDVLILPSDIKYFVKLLSCGEDFHRSSEKCDGFLDSLDDVHLLALASGFGILCRGCVWKLVMKGINSFVLCDWLLKFHEDSDLHRS
ncbi:hypothetical protein RIF29_25555 [Crotalaria pallida]|uniref:DNA polymerase alpha subunit B n=1 Tax=Crotalaria pallida TaxID=3830 RepID=A0AAN9HZW4_CROPI